MKTLKKKEKNIKAYPVSVQILAGIFLAVVTYFAAAFLSNLVVAATRPIRGEVAFRKRLFNTGDAATAARLKYIQGRLADEIWAVERLIAASKPGLHH